MAVLVWGAWLALVEWWEANQVLALERLRVAGIAVLGLGVTVLAVRWRWKRRRSVSVGVRTVGDGWPPGARSVVAVVPSVEGPRGRLPGSGRPGRVKTNPVLEFWPMVLGQAARLSQESSERVVRAMWVLKEGKPVWGVSVARELGRSVSRSVASAWPGARVEPWPFDETGPPVGEGGGAVVRRYLVPGIRLGRLVRRRGRSIIRWLACPTFWPITPRLMCSYGSIWCPCHPPNEDGCALIG